MSITETKKKTKRKSVTTPRRKNEALFANRVALIIIISIITA